MAGFSDRRIIEATELPNDESEVEGHGIVSKGAIERNEDDKLEVEGHGIRTHAAAESTEVEVEGHGVNPGRMAEGDDVRGHVLRAGKLQGVIEDGDEVEGHGMRPGHVTEKPDEADDKDSGKIERAAKVRI